MAICVSRRVFKRGKDSGLRVPIVNHEGADEQRVCMMPSGMLELLWKFTTYYRLDQLRCKCDKPLWFSGRFVKPHFVVCN